LLDDELDGELAEMRNAVELLQAGEDQGNMRNGYLEQMLMRMYNDLVRLIDERFAQYGYPISAHPPTLVEVQPQDNFYTQDVSQRPEADAYKTRTDGQYVRGRTDSGQDAQIIFVANYQRLNPGASARETAAAAQRVGISLGKTKAAELIKYLKEQGSI